jgi:hypothetical protein
MPSAEIAVMSSAERRTPSTSASAAGTSPPAAAEP